MSPWVKHYARKRENLRTDLKLGTHVCIGSVPVVISNRGQTRRNPGSSQSSEAGVYMLNKDPDSNRRGLTPYALVSTCLPWKCMPVLIHMITHIYIHVRHITHTHGGRETGREGEGERGEETIPGS